MSFTRHSSSNGQTSACLQKWVSTLSPPTHPQMLDLGDTPKPPAKGGVAPFGNPLKHISFSGGTS